MVTVTQFDSITSTVGGQVRFTWPDLIEQFNDFCVGVDKLQLPAFSPAIFEGNQRSKSNAKELTALVMDFDGDVPIVEGIAPFEEAELQFLLYTTYNHRQVGDKNLSGADRYRVIVPLRMPIPADQYQSLWKWAFELTGGAIDRACKDAARAFFLPGVAGEDSEFEFIVGEGQPLDWRKLNLECFEEVGKTPITSNPGFCEVASPKISRHAQRILDGEVEVGERYKSRSELDQALVSSLVKSGHDLDSIRGLLQFSQHASRYLELLHNESEEVAESCLQRSLGKALELPDTFARTEAITTINQLRQMVQQSSWIGCQGQKDRAVLLAHLAIAEQAGKLSGYHASRRDLQEAAKLGGRATDAATKRLIAGGFIRCTAGGGKLLASSYELLVKGEGFKLLSPHSGQAYATQCTTQSHPFEWCVLSDSLGVFEDRKGLGKVGKAIYRCLRDASDEAAWLSVSEIVAQTQQVQRTVQRKLVQMEVLGLVHSTGTQRRKRYSANGEPGWMQIAESLGTTHLQSQRQERHEREREAYRSRFDPEKFHSKASATYFQHRHSELLA